MLSHNGEGSVLTLALAAQAERPWQTAIITGFSAAVAGLSSASL
jgi:hypothetical protein